MLSWSVSCFRINVSHEQVEYRPLLTSHIWKYKETTGKRLGITVSISTRTSKSIHLDLIFLVHLASLKLGHYFRLFILNVFGYNCYVLQQTSLVDGLNWAPKSYLSSYTSYCILVYMTLHVNYNLFDRYANETAWIESRFYETRRTKRSANDELNENLKDITGKLFTFYGKNCNIMKCDLCCAKTCLKALPAHPSFCMTPIF